MTDYFWGQSTNKELKILNDTYGKPDIGDIFTDAELEGLIDCEVDSSRFKAVISRWRKYLMRSYNLFLIRIRKEGYKVADAEERLGYASSQKIKATKSNSRAIAVAGTTEREDLPEHKKPEYDLITKQLLARKTLEAEEKQQQKLLQKANKALEATD